jgi:hypothetical protein
VLEYSLPLQRELVGSSFRKPLIRINGVRFEVIGIAQKSSAVLDPNEVNLLYAPISTAQELGLVQTIQTIYAQASDHDLEKAMHQART